MDKRQTEERLRALKQEEQQLKMQLKLQEHASAYQLQVEWPAKISSSDPAKPLRTDNELLQYRLIEAGLLSDVPVSTGNTVEAFNRFVADLEKTGCYNSVNIELSRSEKEVNSENDLPYTAANVTLDEKRWFRMNAGAGIKMDGWLKPETAVNDGFMPMMEAETSIGLQNLSGCLDQTEFHYTLDSRSQTSVSVTHEQPLYRMLPGALSSWLVEQETGSRFSFRAKAILDTLDYERTRSYKEFQRILSFSACNQHSFASPEQTPDLYYGIDWSIVSRDLVPRRHTTLPYVMDASPEVVSQTGPSLKHSIRAEFRSNGELLDHPFSPTAGSETHMTVEVALPPGNIGFFKCNGGFGMHLPIFDGLSLHTVLNAGYLQSLSFGGLCQRPTLSDRFYVGGPMQFRGFVPAGIGPRTRKGGKSTPGGDALGGDFFYTATCMASITPSIGIDSIDGVFNALGLRLFSFASAGTCVGAVSQTPLSAILKSSRISGGVGIASTALGPRLEASYAWPFRHGPADARQQAQFGIGFSYS